MTFEAERQEAVSDPQLYRKRKLEADAPPGVHFLFSFHPLTSFPSLPVRSLPCVCPVALIIPPSPPTSFPCANNQPLHMSQLLLHITFFM